MIEQHISSFAPLHNPIFQMLLYLEQNVRRATIPGHNR
jgi:hypothetical protein